MTEHTRTVESVKKGYDLKEVASRTCEECGMLLEDAGEFHPYVFCVLKKAGCDPWEDFRTVAIMLWPEVDLPERPPLIREWRESS